MSQQFFASFVKKSRLTSDTYSFYFDRNELLPDWDFLPGQYIRMFLPHDNPDERGTTRFFTIASSPTNKKNIILTIRIIKSTFKKSLMRLKKGDKVRFWGPMGTMTLMENIRTPLVFLAGGIGMTPFYSMILYIYEKKLTVPVTLFVSFSSLEEVVFYEELMNIAKERENITIIYTISEPITPSTPWDGETGRISKELLQKYLVDIPKQTFFIVGSATMVDSIEKLVQSMGVSESSIIRETYPGY